MSLPATASCVLLCLVVNPCVCVYCGCGYESVCVCVCVCVVRTDAVRGVGHFDYHRLDHTTKRPTKRLKLLTSACREDVLSASVVYAGNEAFTTASHGV